MPVSRAADEETDTETARRRLDVRHRDPMGQTRRVPQHSGPREAENGFVEQLLEIRKLTLVVLKTNVGRSGRVESVATPSR